MTNEELGKLIYPKAKEGWSMECDYDPIIEHIGKILVQCDQDGYEGDTLAIVESEGRYGYVEFGWGSCSGCDSLQACNTFEEIGELAKSISDSTKWFDSLQEVKEYVANRDWKGTFIDSRLAADFIEKVKEIA